MPHHGIQDTGSSDRPEATMLLPQAGWYLCNSYGMGPKGTPPAGPHIECQLEDFDPGSWRRWLGLLP